MDDVHVNDDVRACQTAMMVAIDGLLVALETDGDAATAASAAEDAMEDLHSRLEQSYGIGLISDWTAVFDSYDVPVVTVRLAVAVLNEEARAYVAQAVDERLCQGLDESRFAILSTTRVFPGARGSAADAPAVIRTPVLAPDSLVPPWPHPEFSSKLEKQRKRLTDALQSLLDALSRCGDDPRKKTLRHAFKQQERFENQMEGLHRKVLRRTGTPLVSSGAYMWDGLAWSGPVVLRTVFDVDEDETLQALLAAIAETLEGLAPDDFSLASATPVNS